MYVVQQVVLKIPLAWQQPATKASKAQEQRSQRLPSKSRSSPASLSLAAFCLLSKLARHMATSPPRQLLQSTLLGWLLCVITGALLGQGVRPVDQINLRDH